jgi:membrane protein YqaA with SNARE-associated domain
LPPESVERQPSLLRLTSRVLLGLVLMIGVVFALGRLLRPELEAFGRGFVGRYGLVGMGLGTFIADGFHLPVPPQFYMLLGITSGVPPTRTLTAICLGSFLGGWTGFLVSGRFLRFERVARWFDRPRRLTMAVVARYGAWALIGVSVLPIAYSVLCYLCGLSGVSRRSFFVVSVLRVPRLFVYYYIVHLGWSGLPG